MSDDDHDDDKGEPDLPFQSEFGALLDRLYSIIERVELRVNHWSSRVRAGSRNLPARGRGPIAALERLLPADGDFVAHYARLHPET